MVVKGYTSTNVQLPDLPNHTVIRCSDDYMGKAWYDFVTVLIKGRTIPGKVIGIVRYGDMERLVVHTMSLPDPPRFNFYKEMKETFIKKFELGNVSCIHFVDASRLQHPLIVFPNYGENIKKSFIALSPIREWPEYFRRTIIRSKGFKTM